MSDAHDHSGRRPELVTVVTHARLVDAESREQVYWRRDGTGLAPGLYVATWPPGAARHAFNEDAHFSGPYPSEQEAEEALERATAHWSRHQRPASVLPRGAARTPGTPMQ